MANFSTTITKGEELQKAGLAFFLTHRCGGDRRSLYKDHVNVGEKLLLDTGKVSKVTH